MPKSAESFANTTESGSLKNQLRKKQVIMPDFLKLILPFFLFPTDYAEMRKKLASLLFWEAYIITFFLRDIPDVDKVLTLVENYGKVGQALSTIKYYAVLNFSGALIAAIVAVCAYIFHLHDRISDVVGIRRQFDKNHILLPLAQLTGSSLTKTQVERLAQNRDSLMRRVFYRYTSSKANNPLVDKHDIHNALDNWCWFWFFAEAALLLIIAASIVLYLKPNTLDSIFAGISILAVVLGTLQYLRLKRYARPQIEAIASDANAAAEVKREFDAL